MEIAVLFDWDGVVLDSSGLHRLSWAELARRRELNPMTEEQFLASFGQRNEVIIPELLRWAEGDEAVRELADLKESIYRELVVSEGVVALPGVGELLAGLKEAGIPAVVGSSTPRKNIEVILDQLGFREHFLGVVSGDDVSRGKPDPEVFLKGARIAGVSPGRCLVIEDAHVGLQAAAAAGMRALGVATTHPAETLEPCARVVHRLDEVGVSDLVSLVEGT